MLTQIRYDVRPFRPEDRAAIIEIGNRDRAPHRHQTVAGWEYWDSLKSEGQVELRLVVADPAAGQALAYLYVADLNTTSWKMADVCEFGIEVDQTHRRQGIGAMLYDRALAFARERGAKRLITGFQERSPEEPAIGFLTRRGFAEQERERPSYLDLATWDPAPFLPYIERAEAQGLRLLSYADVPDTEENRRKLYDLFVPVIYDVPRRDDQPFTVKPFEEYAKIFRHPKWTPELLQLAEAADGQWVGLSHIMPKFDSDGAMQWLTGVRKDYRGQGIATAMKARNYQAAQVRGHSVITTDNHEDNAPMLSVNAKFGFQPEPHFVGYNKVLRDAE